MPVCTHCKTAFTPKNLVCPSCGTISPGREETLPATVNSLSEQQKIQQGGFREQPERVTGTAGEADQSSTSPAQPIIEPYSEQPLLEYSSVNKQSKEQMSPYEDSTIAYTATHTYENTATGSSIARMSSPVFPQTYQLPAIEPPRMPPVLLLVVLFSLIILLFFSGISLIGYSTFYRPQQLHAQATVDTHHTETAITHVTGTAIQHLTSTAQAQATAIGRKQATQTAVAQATQTAQQNIYTQATSGQPALSTTLATQSAAGWQTYDSTAGGGCFFQNGSLHSSVHQKGYYDPCYAENQRFSNFALEVDMTIIQGDEGGVLFRADENAHKSYYFSVSSDGRYILDVITRDGESTNLLYQKSAQIKDRGQVNTLTAIVQNDTFYLYINKQFVGSAQDSTFTDGLIAVFSLAKDNSTEVSFNNLRVWRL